MQTAPLPSKPRDKSNSIFSRTVLAVCTLYFDLKYKDPVWSKGTSLECAELIYMKTTDAACIGEELCCLLREEDVGQIVSLGSFHIERVRCRLHILRLE